MTPEKRIKKMADLVQEKKFDQAQKELRILMEQYPTDLTVLSLGGQIFFGLNELDSALSYARKLTALYPGFREGFIFMHKVASLKQDYDTQLWAVTQLSYMSGDRKDFYFEIADLNFKRGQYGLSKVTCYDILAYDPQNPQVLFLLANNLAAIGQLDSAIVVLTELDQRSPNKVEILSNLASFAVAKKDYGSAEKYFGKLVQIYPDYLPGWFGLGNVRLERGDSSGARAAYMEAYDRDSTFLRVDTILSCLRSSPAYPLSK